MAEEAGFDAVFLPEFHQARGGALVSPLLVGAALLQGTSRIRFGSAVLATPLAPSGAARRGRDHARLDHTRPGHARARDRTSGARLQRVRGSARRADRGVRGGARPPRPLLRGRAVHVRGQALHERGAHHAAALHAAAARDLGRRALAVRPRARRAAAAISGSPTRSATCRRSRSSRSPTAGTPRSSARRPRIGIFREAWIGDSKEECERVWAANPMQVHRLYYNVGTYKKRFEPWVDDAVDRENFTLDKLAPGRFLYGSPEEIRAEVEEWRELTGCEYLALRFRHPGGPAHARDDGGAAPLRRRGDRPPGSTDDHDRSPTMTVSTTTDQLFSPFEIGGLHLPNRIVMPAMGTGLPEHDGTCNDATIAYYRRRAEGGVGMITIEASLVSPDAYGVGPELRLHGEEYIPACGGWSRRCARTGSRSGSSSGTRAGRPCSASRSRRRRCRSPPGRRCRTSSRARRSTRSSTSTPLGVGLAAGRLRLRRDPRRALLPPVRVHLAALEPPHRRVRRPAREPRALPARDRAARSASAAATTIPVMYRISGAEGADGWLRGRGRRGRLPDARGRGRVRDQRLGRETGTRSIRRSARCSFRAASSSRSRPRSSAAVSVPVIAVGRLDDAALAEKILADGDGRLIAIGRGLIADPDCRGRWQEGTLDEIRPCIACNACVDLVANAKQARCAVNPEVGREDAGRSCRRRRRAA